MSCVAQGSLCSEASSEFTVRHLPYSMPIPSSSSYPPQPLTAGSSSCGCSRPYASPLNSGVGALDSAVGLALSGAATVVPVAAAAAVGKLLYQLICFWPTIGMLDPLARPYSDINISESTDWNGFMVIPAPLPPAS